MTTEIATNYKKETPTEIFGSTTKYKKISDIPKNQMELMFAFDTPNKSNAKNYFAMPINTQDEIARMEKMLKHNNHIYEIIKPNEPVNFYFDLKLGEKRYNAYPDVKTEADILLKDKNTLKLVTHVIMECFVLRYDIQVYNYSFCFLNSCEIAKLSYRFIIKSCIYAESVAEICDFANFVVQRMIELRKLDATKYSVLFYNDKPIVDLTVYGNNQPLCMVNQSNKLDVSNKAFDRMPYKNNTILNTFVRCLNIDKRIKIDATLRKNVNIVALPLTIQENVNIHKISKPPKIKKPVETPINTELQQNEKNLRQYLEICNIQYDAYIANDDIIKNCDLPEVAMEKLHLQNSKYVFLKFVNGNIDDATKSMLFYDYWMNEKKQYIKHVFYEKNMETIKADIDKLTEDNNVFCHKMQAMMSCVVQLNNMFNFNGSYDITTIVDRTGLASVKQYLFENWVILKELFNSSAVIPKSTKMAYNAFAYRAIKRIYSMLNSNQFEIVTKVSDRNMDKTTYVLRGIDWNTAIKKSSISPQDKVIILREYENTNAPKYKVAEPVIATEIHLTANILQRNPILTQNLQNVTINFPVDIDNAHNITIRVESGKNPQKTKTKKYTKKPITKKLKRLVWERWIGVDVLNAKCFCCKKADLTNIKFVCGHVVAEACGGESSVDNMRPICKSCNSSMRMENMFDHMKRYGYV